MCLILFAWQTEPGTLLRLVANRDEYFSRPTLPLHAWPEEPWIVAGQDREGGGTWMGLSTAGRFAAVTNLRVPPYPHPRKRSRGLLPTEFLRGAQSVETAAQQVVRTREAYAPFNLLLCDGRDLWYAGSGLSEPQRLAPGHYGLSNGALDAPWPKVEQGRRQFAALAAEADPEASFTLMGRTEAFTDRSLPDTGIGEALERALSPMFHSLPAYGTRSTTLLTVTTSGEARLVERCFHPPPGHRPSRYSERRWRVPFPCPPPT